MQIFLDEPEIILEDIIAVQNELRHYPFSTASKTVDKFEQEMAKFLGVSETVAVNSGTSALHLALLASGIKSGDEVIMPALTFVGTANAVAACGAKPVFVDVDLDTWNLNLNWSYYDWHAKTWPKFKTFILGVDLYGNPFQIDHNKFPDFLNVKVVDDASESLGSVGDTGVDYSCFSFNGNKIMTTSGGGLIVGNDLDKIRRIADQGLDRHETECIEPGFNYKMTGIQAALGLSQLKRLPKFIKKKRRINEIYRNELPMLKFQEATEGSRPNWWFTAVHLLRWHALYWQDLLAQRGVPTRRIFKPLHLHKAYLTKQDLRNSQKIYCESLCLPSSVLNGEKEIIEVCKTIKKMLK